MFESVPRSLSMPEFRALRKIEDANESDVYLLSCAYDADTADVEDWFNKAPMAEAGKALQAAWEASGLTVDARFQDSQADDVVPSGEAE